MPRTPDLLLGGLHFPEGPRWRAPTGDGRLFFSDMLARRVMAVDLAGRSQMIAEVPRIPSGLGWTPDGTLHVVSVEDGQLLAVGAGGALRPVADVKAVSGLICNDMVMDGQGRAWVGSPETSIDESRPPGPGNMPGFGHIVRVDAALDAKPRLVADRMNFPNGCVVTPDGKTLIVAESFGFRITAFDIRPDGTLENRRPWADLGVPPDGICLDADDCLWVAVCYFAYGSPGGYLRLAEGGRVLARIEADGCSAYACTLGGPAMRTLFLCESAVLGRDRHPGDGRIRAVDVDVPGIGSP